jgi:hypothetical protein
MSTISAKKKDSDKVVSLEYDMPETLEALTEKFGAEVVASAAVDSFTISIQSLIRRHFDKSQEEIEAAVAAWQPGVRTAGVKKTPLEKAQAALKAMSPEDRAALLASLNG